MRLEKKLVLKCIAYDCYDLKKVISTIENGGLKIALILNDNNKLVGIISDGDIRKVKRDILLILQ